MELSRPSTSYGTQPLGNESIIDKVVIRSEQGTLELNVLIAISASISVIGTVSNVMSLSYFLSNWSNKLGEILLVLLNIMDLLVSLMGTLFLALRYFVVSRPLVIVAFMHGAYFVFLECTAFVTLLLAVARSLSLHFPFYEPSTKNLIFSLVAFFSYAVVKASIAVHYRIKVEKELAGLGSKIWLRYFTVYNTLLFSSLLLAITVVLTVNLLTIRKLIISGSEINCAAQPASTHFNRHATITILILSALFCIFNMMYSVALCRHILLLKTTPIANRTFTSTLIDYTAVPLNSALNPFVYFSRKREMRTFLCRSFYRRASGDQRVATQQ